MLKRSWVTIDLKQIVKNYLVYQNNLKPNQKVMAVVKANAYGHGDVEVSKALQQAGCYDFAVSNLQEGINLREAGIKGSILILGYTPFERLKDCKKYDIIQAVFSKDYLDGVIKSGVKVSIQFKIETGMNRLGFEASKQTETLIRKTLKILDVKGFFTHLCVSDDDNMNDYTDNQISTFQTFANGVKDLNFEFVHYLNSAGGMYHNDGFSTHARLGISLYGLKPDYPNVLPKGMAPAIEWKSTIVMIKKISKGDKVGYGATFEATRDTLVATVCTGYADGLSRRMSNGGSVYVRSKQVKIIGRVCMDQFMIDVTDVEGVQPYDEVTILGKEQDPNDMANYLGTIAHEVVCGISPRVVKIYKN